MQNYDDSTRRFYSYTMMFFKESTETNLENIKKNQKDLDDGYAEQNDLMLVFSWTNEKKPHIDEIKNGRLIIKNGQVIIMDVEKSNKLLK